MRIRLHRPDGTPLAPGVLVEETEEGVAVLLESAGGSASGDYPIALGMLLEALAGLGASIADAYVDSRHAHELGLDRSSLRLELRGGRSYPVNLPNESDLEDLRKAIGAAQAPIGRPGAASGGGNRNKRIRIVLTPGEPSAAAIIEELQASGGAGTAKKQEIVDEICGMLGLPPSVNSNGSSVRAEFLDAVLTRLGVNTDAYTSNPARVQAALAAVGEPFDVESDTSTQSDSGGGNTVPKPALLKLRRGLKRLMAAQALLAPTEMSALTSPTADAGVAERRALTLEMTRAPGEPPVGRTTPRTSTTTKVVNERDPAVTAWVREQAAGTCELCGSPAPFTRAGGIPFLEVHHVVPLAERGSDTVTNAVALCPNCHRACHHSEDADDRLEALYRQVSRLRRE